jgi:CMP-N,N'-diacetyllegionaminic acid synthase
MISSGLMENILQPFQMIQNKKILGIIPARGGSKGVPRKNLRMVADKPLIAWTIESARQSKYIDRLILSSDDDEIMNVANQWGCEVPFKRPSEFAKDNSSSTGLVLHALDNLPDYDYVVLLQVTSPLRRVEDIDACLLACVTKRWNAAASVAETDKSPYWMYTLNDVAQLKPVINTGKTVLRRQDLPETYALNGAIYVVRSDWFLNTHQFVTDETHAFPMPRERSLDIDSEQDLILLELLLTRKDHEKIPA